MGKIHTERRNRLIEEWRSVCGFEGYYEVSNTGNVRSCDRYVNAKLGSKSFLKGEMMKLQKNHKGYMTVILHKNNKHYSKTVHRLVAEAFIDNPENLPQVNHKDTDKTNNNVTNLEWISNYDNMQHAMQHGCYKNAFTEKARASTIKNLEKAIDRLKIAVIQYDMGWNKIREFESISFAGRTLGISASKIVACCKGKRNMCGGYRWKYKEEI